MKKSLPAYSEGNAYLFQPALPMRGVTDAPLSVLMYMPISTRTPHAGSDGNARDGGSLRGISTRTPHAGSDRCAHWCERRYLISTRTPHAGSDGNARDGGSLRGISTRTPHAGSDVGAQHRQRQERISTRTPHAGSDSTFVSGRRRSSNFNPHSPCGE